MKTVQTWARVFLLSSLAFACGITDVGNTDFEANEPFSFDVALANQSRVHLRGVNGSITITGDPIATSITIEGERRARSESMGDAMMHINDVQVRVSEWPDEIVVETLQPSASAGRSYEVEYWLVVPARLDVELENTNGNIEIRFGVGDVAVINVNGDVTLTGTRGSAEVNLVNGRIDAQLDPVGHPPIDLQTVNGQIDLSVPTSVSCRLEARLTNGTISVSNLVMTDVTQTPTSLRGTVGGGLGTADLQLVNGDITITGRNWQVSDGRVN